MELFIIFLKHKYTLQYFLSDCFIEKKGFNFSCDMGSDRTSISWREELSQSLNVFDLFNVLHVSP